MYSFGDVVEQLLDDEHLHEVHALQFARVGVLRSYIFLGMRSAFRLLLLGWAEADVVGGDDRSAHLGVDRLVLNEVAESVDLGGLLR
jgi:hypothetical protein